MQCNGFEMVQVLIDFRHLARVRLLDMVRLPDNRFVKAVFVVSSRVTARSKSFEAQVEVAPGTTRHDAMARLWVEVLNKDIQSVRKFVSESATLPSSNEPLELFPLGPDDDVDKIDGSLITGTLEGTSIRDGTITSDQVRSLDASKLVGTIDPERLRWSGLTLDMIGGQIDGARIGERSIDHRHIRSVDAAVITGELTNVVLPPNSILDEHIASVSWDRVVGAPSNEFVSSIKIEDLGGVLQQEQLPESISPSRVDLSAGLDLSLFTQGQLPVDCIQEHSIEARHVKSVDAAQLIGSLDGQIIIPGTIPTTALTALDARLLFGALAVDEVYASTVDSECVTSGYAKIGGDLSCANLVVHDHATVADNLLVGRRVQCQALDASAIITSETISSENIEAFVLVADTLTSECVDATLTRTNMVTASEVETENLVACEVLTSALSVDSLTTRDATITRAIVDNVDAATVSVGELQARNASIDCCTVLDQALVEDLHVNKDLHVGGDISASSVTSDRVTTGIANLGSLCAGALEVQDTATFLQGCDVRGTIRVGSDMYVHGLLSTSDIDIQGLMYADAVSSDFLCVTSSCDLEVARVKGALTVDGEMTVNGGLNTVSDIKCAALTATDVVCDLVEASDVRASNVVTQEVDAQSVSTVELSAASIESSRMVVREALHTKSVSCENIGCSTAKVSDLLEVSGVLVCEDMLCDGEVDVDCVEVSTEVQAGVLEVTDDVVVGGVSMSHKIREIEELVASISKSSSVGRPLDISRRQYFADTQFLEGHDRIEASSPAFPAEAIYFDLPVTSDNKGLSVTERGDIVGRGQTAGVFSIPTRASVTSQGETHSLQVSSTFTIFGPAQWITPVQNTVDQKTLFYITLSADDATSFADADPRLPGVSVQSGSITGTIGSPGVYHVGAMALRTLEHNDHVLEQTRVFETTVRPLRPLVNATSGAFAITGSPFDMRLSFNDSGNNATSFVIEEIEARSAPVEWVTSSEVSTVVGTLDFQLVASGASEYVIVTRGTLPLEVRLDGSGKLSGQIDIPIAFTMAVRAQGLGGIHRPAALGGHVDREFNVAIRPFAVNFDQLVLPVHIELGVPVSFEILHPEERVYVLEVV